MARCPHAHLTSCLASILTPVVMITVAGCAAAPSSGQEARVEAVPVPAVESAVSDVLGFARWVEGASVEELQTARPEIERAMVERDDAVALLRLSLILNEPRGAGADPERARVLLQQFLHEAGSPEHDDLRNLAVVLAGNWRERNWLTRALRNAEQEAQREREALVRERERRVLAENRLGALIEVERRVKRTTDPIEEVKPVSK